jgi:hypothetical protein
MIVRGREEAPKLKRNEKKEPNKEGAKPPQ